MDKKDLDSGNPEPKKLSSDAYDVGHWKTEAVLFKNRQWAVTEFGIENITGPEHYYIKKDLLPSAGEDDRTLCQHMAGKSWVDDAAFEEAFDKAIEIHNRTSGDK